MNAIHTNVVAAAEVLFTIANARRVVARRKDNRYVVCSRSKARRLGHTIVAKNY